MKLLLFVFFCSLMAISTELCDLSFNATSEQITTKFMAFLQDRVEAGALNEDDINDMLIELERGVLINPFASKSISKENELYGKIFQEYLEEANLRKKDVLKWLVKIINKEKNRTSQKNAVSMEVKGAFLQIQFAPISPGSVTRRVGPNRGTARVTRPIEVMTTPVTNAQWSEIFNYGEKSDLPHTGSTLYSKLVFANKLSEKKGFRPVYNLSQMQQEPLTSAEEGTLKFKLENGMLGFSHQNYYESEGYRLPTHDEQLLLMKLANLELGPHESIFEYAFVDQNSEKKMREVGEKKPIYIGDFAFYDVFGNVSEQSMTSDSELLTDYPALMIKTPKFLSDYQYYSDSSPAIYSTGSYKNGVYNFFSMPSQSPIAKNKDIGFRLVRTLKK